MRELPLVLQLDVAGNPSKWITYEDSAYYYAKDLVSWSLGEVEFDLHGGTSAETGEQSILTVNTIIAIKGKVGKKQFASHSRVPLTNKTLFRRDKKLCAYCGHTFPDRKLTRDHIHPTSKGGKNIWMNLVTSCESCNRIKSDRSLEECGMELLYVPYIPNRAEYLILSNRKILTDQMDFLIKRVPQESRLLV